MIEKTADINFYKNLYENEINRKNEINGLINFPTTLLTLMIAGGFYLYQPIFKNEYVINNLCLFRIEVLISLLFVISIAISVFFLIRMYHNLFRKYHYLPSPEKLKNREIELFMHYEKIFSENNKSEIEEKSIEYAKQEFNKDLLNYYIDNSTKNQLVNDNRYKDYYRSRHYLMISLIILAISGILIILK